MKFQDIYKKNIVDQKIKKILRESILEYFDDYNDYSDISTLSDIDVDNKAYQTVRQLKIDKAIKEKLKTITFLSVFPSFSSNTIQWQPSRHLSECPFRLTGNFVPSGNLFSNVRLLVLCLLLI